METTVKLKLIGTESGAITYDILNSDGQLIVQDAIVNFNPFQLNAATTMAQIQKFAENAADAEMSKRADEKREQVKILRKKADVLVAEAAKFGIDISVQTVQSIQPK